jgi:hypothetical protein
MRTTLYVYEHYTYVIQYISLTYTLHDLYHRIWWLCMTENT